VSVVTQRSEAQATIVDAASETWGKLAEEIKLETTTSLEACQAMLLSRAEYTKKALEEETRQRELLQTWFKEQGSIAAQAGRDDAKREAAALRQIVNTTVQRCEEQRLSLCRAAERMEGEVAQERTRLARAVHDAVARSREDISNHAANLDKLIMDMKEDREMRAREGLRELQERGITLSEALEASQARQLGMLQHEADARRESETTALQRHTELEVACAQTAHNNQQVLLGLKDGHAALSTELRAQVAACRAQLDGRAGTEWIEETLQECRVSIQKQAEVLALMCGGTASSMQDTSVTMDVAGELLWRNG